MSSLQVSYSGKTACPALQQHQLQSSNYWADAKRANVCACFQVKEFLTFKLQKDAGSDPAKRVQALLQMTEVPFDSFKSEMKQLLKEGVWTKEEMAVLKHEVCWAAKH